MFAVPFIINSQYIKDVSFKNFSPAQTLAPQNKKPGLGVEVGVNVQKLTENMYTTTLHIQAEAKQEKNRLFSVNLWYTGICTITNKAFLEKDAKDKLRALLLIDVPHCLFHAAKEIIASLSQQGGQAPLILAPFNFEALYKEQLKKEAAKGQKKVAAK